MAKDKDKPRRRGTRSIAGLQTMQLLAGAVAFWGPQLLDKLPHSFDSLKAGQGKGILKNKRVLIVLAGVVYAMTSKKLSTRLWSLPLLALLALAVSQHKVTYGGAKEATMLVESYKDGGT